MFSSFSSWAYFMKLCYNTNAFLKTLKPSGAQKRNYHFTTTGAS